MSREKTRLEGSDFASESEQPHLSAKDSSGGGFARGQAESLSFGTWFDHDLQGVTFPAGLQRLPFGSFDQPLGVMWPNGLQRHLVRSSTKEFCQSCDTWRSIDVGVRE
ncbi:unnamed protein product [Effrenium voratum]|nr:unnamed protein product [Effrenium voratum]